MLKRERQEFILHQVNLHNKMLCADLSAHMQVSDDTVRRDLQELADAGKILKVHGGALSLSFASGASASDTIYSHKQKQVIARKAAALIEKGMYVLTGGGTTILEMARGLPPDLQATFISGSLPALTEYINHPRINVVAIGDKVSKEARMTVGPEAIARIREFNADLCILGINAIDIQTGVSDNDWDVVQLKKAMIQSSQKLICLTISEKINSKQPLQVCPAKAIHTLITELSPEDPILQPYRAAGIEVI